MVLEIMTSRGRQAEDIFWIVEMSEFELYFIVTDKCLSFVKKF